MQEAEMFAKTLRVGVSFVALALMIGCGASFKKSDALTSADLKGAQAEAEKRIQAGQRLKILRSQAAAANEAPQKAEPTAPESPEAKVSPEPEPSPEPLPDSE